MVASALAGMELLGGLLSSPALFNTAPPSGNGYFLSFWDKHLCEIEPRYLGLGSLVRALIRNGVAHTFVAKGGIGIVKGKDGQPAAEHLATDGKTFLCIDAVRFYLDFNQTYNQRIKPLSTSMQANLDEMERLYQEDTKKRFAALPTGVPVTQVPGVTVPVSIGMSGTFDMGTFGKGVA